MTEIKETIGGVAAEALQQYVDRIERLEEEKAALSADISAVYVEVKSTGFDVKVLRKVIAARKIADQQRKEQEAIMDTYLRALGME